MYLNSSTVVHVVIHLAALSIKLNMLDFSLEEYSHITYTVSFSSLKLIDQRNQKILVESYLVNRFIKLIIILGKVKKLAKM